MHGSPPIRWGFVYPPERSSRTRARCARRVVDHARDQPGVDIDSDARWESACGIDQRAWFEVGCRSVDAEQRVLGVRSIAEVLVEGRCEPVSTNADSASMSRCVSPEPPTSSNRIALEPEAKTEMPIDSTRWNESATVNGSVLMIMTVDPSVDPSRRTSPAEPVCESRSRRQPVKRRRPQRRNRAQLRPPRLPC